MLLCVVCDRPMLPELQMVIFAGFLIGEALAWTYLGALLVLTATSLAFKVALVLHRIAP